jgi:hypothetical protein
VDPDAVRVAGLPGRLESLVRSTPWLLQALRAARDVDPPDWLVGGGVLPGLPWVAERWSRVAIIDAGGAR